jgi:hypothetical protein
LPSTVASIVDGWGLLGDDGLEHVRVAEAGMVGAAVADQMHGPVLGDHAVAQRAGQVRVAVAHDLDRGRGALGHGVVDHHAVHRTPRALGVAVVVLPVAGLDDVDALGAEQRGERCRAGWCGHGVS